MLQNSYYYFDPYNINKHWKTMQHSIACFTLQIFLQKVPFSTQFMEFPLHLGSSGSLRLYYCSGFNTTTHNSTHAIDVTLIQKEKMKHCINH